MIISDMSYQEYTFDSNNLVGGKLDINIGGLGLNYADYQAHGINFVTGVTSGPNGSTSGSIATKFDVSSKAWDLVALGVQL